MITELFRFRLLGGRVVVVEYDNEDRTPPRNSFSVLGLGIGVGLLALGLALVVDGGCQPTNPPPTTERRTATALPLPSAEPVLMVATNTAVAATATAEPTIAATATMVAAVATAEPATSIPVATVAVAATLEPTAIPVPSAVPATAAPVPTIAGVAPTGSGCPADHPVKGNIVDRGANKGEKIYHLPGVGAYAATKPERCFVDAAEAVAAGFRAPK